MNTRPYIVVIFGRVQGCAIDMTPATPEEAMLQKTIFGSLGAVVAAPVAAEAVAVYGPIVSTSAVMAAQQAWSSGADLYNRAAPVVNNIVNTATPYLNSVQTFAQTQAAGIQQYGIVQYVYSHPEEVNDFTTEFASSFVESLGEKTGLPPTPSYAGLAGTLFGTVAGETAQALRDVINDAFSNRQDVVNRNTEMVHPKK